MRRRRRWTGGLIGVGFVVLGGLLAGPACGGGGGGGGSGGDASHKVLRVGSDIEYAPIEFYKAGTQEIQGLDYDLALALGKELGFKVEFVNDTDFAGMIGALAASRFDVIMSAMNDTAERRAKGVDFIDYFKAGSSILVQKGNPKGIKSVDDLCGNTVSVQKGTTQDTDILTPQEGKCRDAKKPIEVLRFEKDTDALQQVKNGRAVADLEDFPVAAYNAQTSGGGADFEVVPGQFGDVGAYGIAVRKGDKLMRDNLRAALQTIIKNGTYDQILARWNVSAGALKTAAINGEE
ncbi:MAG TPA: ABC transporter substrate-binding protein [Acidimicrobiia bacterium]|nr:ABC transporter substrate-binding protein [Acidimicrobiia bacterium]